ncbi:MAG TPA: tRNA (N6-isopentenyl adenosine(37)-C2)-methylthiotransferase MiaB [Rhodoblastus sp.]|nr:tRNA (N6-isopentenyl adenosine(37)-C2)-methylthiotransferase MiaB [Rhodoblastus sp.]
MTEGSKALGGGYVKSYGCQMNVYDSSRIAGLLEGQGHSAVDTPAAADVIVLNTCHIREKAADKVFSELGQIRRIKAERAKQDRPLLIGVAGCVAQAEGAEILRREAAVDFVLGPQAYHRLPEALEKARRGERPLFIDFETDEKFRDLRRPAGEADRGRISAFVTIQEGCDKFCSFCVVPYTRGAEVSRSAPDIVTEVERIASAGVKDVTLLGQNVNGYRWEGGDGVWTLARLFARLSEITDLVRLRYTTSHPLDMSDELIAAHRDLPKVMPYLHLPVQSGSDSILRAMNRRHTARDYLTLIDKIRTARPDIALSSDFIVGFPGETDEDFRDTIRLVEEVGFASAFSFKYSRRPGTPGAELANQVAEPAKKERLAQLQELLERQSIAFNSNCVGRTLDVLFEKPGRHAGQAVGRSPYLQSVQVDATPELIGSVAPVRIERRGPHSLFGALETHQSGETRV